MESTCGIGGSSAYDISPEHMNVCYVGYIEDFGCDAVQGLTLHAVVLSCHNVMRPLGDGHLLQSVIVYFSEGI
jgi:hypothetical protein